MKKMFEELRAQRRSTSGNSASSSGRRPPFSGERGASQGERSAKDKSRRGMAMVWVLEEGHKLRPVPVKTGVTGDEYTEIVRSDLKEGDEVAIFPPVEGG